jgi:hypothetical protein
VAGGMAQGVGPDFKPQNLMKKKKKELGRVKESLIFVGIKNNQTHKETRVFSFKNNFIF